MTLERINLNLVPVLRALLKTRSVSAAAALLGRSPSAVSESLSQLRLILGDQLLVRVGAHLQLTPKAADLVESLEEVHERLRLLFRSGTFDPATSTRSFTIASSDLLINEIGPEMVKLLREHAPKMSLCFVDVAHGLTGEMAAREIDFALLPDFAINDLSPAPIKFVPLYDVPLTALMSREHPLAGNDSVTLQEMSAYRQISFQPDPVLRDGRRNQPPPGTEIYADFAHFDAAVTVSQFLTIPRLLEGTDLIAIVPYQIADAARHCASVIAVKLGYEYRSSRMGLAWSPVHDRDPAHAWLRRLMIERRNAREPVAALENNKKTKAG